MESESFLKLCGLRAIKWRLNKNFVEKSAQKPPIQENFWPVCFSQALTHQSQNYGKVDFLSLKIFSVKEKRFLTRIAQLIASALFFIEQRERAESIRTDWNKAFDSFTQAFCVTDKNFKILQANRRFCEIKGLERLEGRDLFSLLPGGGPKPLGTKKQGSRKIEWEKQGKKLVWEISFKSLFLRGENAKVFLFLLKDLTEESEMEQKLAEQTEQRELGLVKGSLAHELNNPLAGIKTLLKLLEKEIPFSQENTKDRVRKMRETANRCCSVVQQLLSASQNGEKRASDTA